MSDPVTIEVAIDDLERLLRLASECSEDLLAELDERYSCRSDYPSEQRRYLRETAPIESLRLIMDRIAASSPDPRLAAAAHAGGRRPV